MKKKPIDKDKALAAEVMKNLREPPKIVGAYTCEECGAWHADEEDAQECCPRGANNADGWECPDCDEIYETEDEAYECCEDKVK
jgi:hypothetical protein